MSGYARLRQRLCMFFGLKLGLVYDFSSMPFLFRNPLLAPRIFQYQYTQIQIYTIMPIVREIKSIKESLINGICFKDFLMGVIRLNSPLRI